MPEVPPDARDSVRWPEVYSLIDETRKELGAEIKNLGEKVEKWVLPTENRLTLVEANLATHVQQFAEHRQLIDDAHAKIAQVQARQETDEAATQALQNAENVASKVHEKKVQWWQWVIGTMLGVPLTISAIDGIIKLFQ